MIRLPSKIPYHWINKIEVAIVVMWLLYFMNVSLRDPLPDRINALSYPIIAVLFALHWKRILWVMTRDLPLLLLIATILASALWSDNPDRTLDAFKAVVRMFIFGAYLTACYSIKEQMKILAWVVGIAATLSATVAFVIPSYGVSSFHGGAWEGIFAHKGMLGDVMSFGAILYLILAIKDGKFNWLAWVGFGGLIAINVLTDSASSLLSFIIMLSLMPLYQLVKQPYKLKAILIAMGCIFASGIAIFILSNSETILVDFLNQNTDGRLSIWTLMVEKIIAEERFWLGYGFNAFWSSDAGSFVAFNAWKDSSVGVEFNAHSSYMEIFASLGIFGIAVYALSLMTTLLRTVMLLVRTKKSEFFWLIQFLVLAHIAGISNVGKIVSGASSYWAIYIAICLSTAVEYRRLRHSQRKPLNTYRGFERTINHGKFQN